jgi:polygalacturonase
MNTSLKNQKLAASVRVAAPVKNFVKKPLMLALAGLALSAVAAPSFAATWWSTTPKNVQGKTTIEVRSKGALGNGVHDDTAAFQAAINALPADGGTVHVSAGHYMVNPLKPIKMRSHTRLLMDSGATLEAIPNNAERYRMIQLWKVTDVRIVGGNLVGDRAKHKGSTGEWGFGIYLAGATNTVIKSVKVSNFWGDGIWIGAAGSVKTKDLVRSDNVTVIGVTSSNNRRQGLSIGPAQHVYVVNSTFKNSNGTKPEAGIDIEPMGQGPTNAIRLEHNTLSGSRGNGIEMHDNVTDVTITRNTMIDNYGFGLLGGSTVSVNINNNKMTRNGLAGVAASAKSHGWSITGNTVQYNSTRYSSPTKTGGALTRDLQLGTGTYDISVSGNVFSNPEYNTYKQ